MAKRHLDHAIRGAFAVVAVDLVLLAHALVHLFGERARVHADAKRDLPLLGRHDDLHDLVAVGDVAWVQTQAMHTGLDRHQRESVVVVDVRDHRQRRSLDDAFQRLCGLAIGNCGPHYLAA